MNKTIRTKLEKISSDIGALSSRLKEIKDAGLHRTGKMRSLETRLKIQEKFDNLRRRVMETKAIDITGFKSITAGQEHSRLSDKYSFIPTTQVIDVLGSKGWLPVKASETRVRSESRLGFQKHMVRFRNAGFSVGSIGDILPEIVLTNSHDGFASFAIMAGLFRLVCLNGLVVADSMFATHRIRHMGYTDDAVLEAVESASESIPRIASRVKDFQAIELTRDEQNVFATSALVAKYGDEEVRSKRDFDTEALVKPLRFEDRINGKSFHNTLWNTYNIVQEKFINGARFEMKTAVPANTHYRHGGRYKKSKGIKSISENIRINQALWVLTEKMAEIKGAGG